VAELAYLPVYLRRQAQAGAYGVLLSIFMFYVYVIKSKKFNWHYIGMTSNVEKRFAEHNKGKCKSTKHYLPFMLITFKEFSTRILARDFEKFLKISSNKEKIIKEFAV